MLYIVIRLSEKLASQLNVMSKPISPYFLNVHDLLVFLSFKLFLLTVSWSPWSGTANIRTLYIKEYVKSRNQDSCSKRLLSISATSLQNQQQGAGDHILYALDSSTGPFGTRSRLPRGLQISAFLWRTVLLHPSDISILLCWDSLVADQLRHTSPMSYCVSQSASCHSTQEAPFLFCCSVIVQHSGPCSNVDRLRLI
jgi:hypothetical protein